MSGVPLNIDFQQILLHLLNVAILFFILYFLLYKPVKNFMDKRRQEYQDMEDKANENKKQAEELKASYETKLKEADEEIVAMRADAQNEISNQLTSAKQQAKEQAEQILMRAREQAEAEKNRILEQTGDQVAQLAEDAASRVIFKDSSEAFDTFLKAANEQQ